jgi:hypothetical protein
MGGEPIEAAQELAQRPWEALVRPYPTVHFWTAQEQPAGMVVTVLRRQELHGCVAVMNFLALPAVCAEKVISISELADLVCRELDRQVAENHPADDRRD